MRPFDAVVVVDWSAAARPTPPRPSVDAIWIGVSRGGAAETSYHRTRSEAMARIEALVSDEPGRVLVGFDFPFGWPRGFARRVAGEPSALAVWEALAGRVADTADNANDRFEAAAALNALFPGRGPFWGRPEGREIEGLAPNTAERGGHGLPERRMVEERVPRAQPGWKLMGAGSVGSQALLGQARLSALRRRVPCAAWPFEPWEGARVVLAEVYPSLLRDAVRARLAADPAIPLDPAGRPIADAAQVAVLAEALHHAPDALDVDMPPGAPDEEGWILGVGREEALRAAALEASPRRPGPDPAPPPSASIGGGGPGSGAGAPRPRRDPGSDDAAVRASPRSPTARCASDAGVSVRSPSPAGASRAPAGALRDDCFALPPGVHWTPVDEALARLRGGLAPVVGAEIVPVGDAFGRVLAEDAVARRSSPPGANAAVDGWGFAYAALPTGAAVLPVEPGRAAAGSPLGRPVPDGRAVRILTGALLPEGVDAVVLQEDVEEAHGRVAFDGPVKPGANTRRAGEDVEAGAAALPAGRVLGAPDLALLSSVGVASVPVRERLRVGVLSTGDEIAEPGETADPARTYDANRPMLLAVLRRWGHEAVDLGRVGDDRAALAARLDGAGAHAVLTSGGASGGDEDHVSALLAARGRVETWRIAIKPGRPLALGLWRGVPVFGLPGNPVAALVCTLVFARPALSVLAGAGWVEPRGFEVPAAFAKRKKAGRREFLRARVRDGRAEVFASEGSGRVSGLSWAEGLVELDDGPRQVAPGDPVRFLPYGAFGL